MATIYRVAVHLQTLVGVTKCLSELADRESGNTIGTYASCLSTKTADCLNSATTIFPHPEAILKSSHSTTLNCMHYHTAPVLLYGPRSANKGRRDSTVCLVARLQSVKQSNFASIPSEDSPLARSIQIGY